MQQSRRMFLRRILLGVSALCVWAPATRAATCKRPLPPVDLAFLEMDLHLIRRDSWALEVPRTWRLRGAGEYDRVTIHHAGNRPVFHTRQLEVSQDLNGILDSHIQRNYGDIAYHFMVDYGGTVWEGRSLAYEGAHVSGQNDGNIGVMLVGNFEEQDPSTAQLASTRRLVERLRQAHNIKPHRVYGHRDLGESVCPGKNLYARLDTVKC